MIKQRFIFYIVALVLFVLLIASISGILLPFILAAVLAYLIDPVVDKLVAKGASRSVVSFIAVGLIFLVIVALFTLAIPLIVDGIKDLNNLLSNYEAIWNNKILPIIQPILPEGLHIPSLTETIRNNSQELTTHIASLVKQIAASTMHVVDFITLFLITPLALYYLLKDWDKLLDFLHTLIPQDDQSYVNQVVKKIDAKLSNFIRGQLMVCLALGVMYGLGLMFVGLKLGLVIGFVTGLLSFIPYVGMILGMLTAFAIAFLQFPLTSVEPFALILSVFVIGQLIESIILSPKLVGDALNMNPLWIIFAVMAGGEIGGFLGILIALPIAAIISVIVKEFEDYYKQSSIYTKGSKKSLLDKLMEK